jgi:DNA-binding beta-propeller fold protein YncE
MQEELREEEGQMCEAIHESKEVCPRQQEDEQMIKLSRRIATVVALVVGVVVALTLGASPALAESHLMIGEFGSFSDPNGIAIDESSGDVYVADIGTDTVDKFDASGQPTEFSALKSNVLTGTGTPAKAFSFPDVYGNPAAIAVDNSMSASDPSHGALYVMDAGNGVIDKFNASGEYLGQIPAATFAGHELLGLGVDANGTLRVEVSTGSSGELRVDVFDDSATNHLVAKQLNEEATSNQSGVPSGQQAHGFAVDSSGDSFVLYESPCSCMAKFGQQLSALGRIDKTESGDVALAVDAATGHVYVDDQSSVAEWDTGAMNRAAPSAGSSEPGEATGVLVDRFGAALLSGTSSQGGIAVDAETGEVYVSNPANGKVDVFDSDAPAVAAGGATNVTKEGATLNGTVDPQGASVTVCQFEYGVAEEYGRVASGHYEDSIPCQPEAADIGSGNDPVEVSAHLERLKSGVLYRFRLVAGNASASSESSGLLASEGVGFGIKSFEVSFLNEDGAPDTQAGSHPYEMLVDFSLNSHFQRIESNANSPFIQEPEGTIRDLKTELPPGLVGDPNATPKKCTLIQLRSGGEGECPSQSAVGLLQLSWTKLITYGTGWEDTLYNMVPPYGVALQLGTNFVNPLLFINNGLLAGGDYPIQATITAAPPAAPVLTSRATISGIVGEGGNRKAFLTLPTGCHGPLRSTIAMDSWQNPGHWVEKSEVTRNAAGTPVSLTGCSKLLFPPTISVVPDSTDASTSSGLTVDVHVPQKTAAFNPQGLAESSLRDTKVTLPEGVAINPSGGDGLEACTSEPGALGTGALGSPGDQIGYKGQEELNAEAEQGVKWNTFTPELASPLAPGTNFCPNGSKIGTVKIKTPLLEHELEGAVYLAAQDNNPFGSLIGMYLVAEDPYSGSLIKLAGEVKLTESGQIVTTFENTPDLPFESLELHFFGGERAPLSTPAHCGTYTTKAIFTPWDGNGPVTAESSFNIEHGPGGGPCPGAILPFNPTVNAGATNIQAGAFSPLTVTANRKDGEQNLKSIEAKLPPGLSGVLSGVELCPEPRANEGLCGENSKVGEATISVGVGNQPFTVTGGKFYLTGPYNGHGGCTVGEAGCAPFGLTFEVPAKAGPFDLANTKNNHPPCDCVVVRGKIELNPLTSAITITSNPLGSPDSIPTSIEGIPLEIQHVNATTTRGNFQFNPTNCSKMSLTGTVRLNEGGTSTITTPFQVTNCAALKFEPKFSVSTSAKTSRTEGASLTAKLTYPNMPQGTDADIARVKVELPKQLPSRLTTLQKACTATQFEANPGGCPAASKIGDATVHTPLIPVPLQGPAIFVSHGDEAFPSLTLVLQGYGITIDLVGTTDIKNGVTSTTFKTVPDQPFSSFELTLPEGPYSALTAPGNLCTAKNLTMPTEFLAQNGAELHQTTKIVVTGCPKHKKAVKRTKRKAKHKRRRARGSGVSRHRKGAKK